MNGPSNDNLGISGRIARTFLTAEITPLLAVAGLLLGLFAVIVTPREEEPQIDVTFANVFIPYPGSTAQEVESLVTTPAEQIVSEIAGVEHIYSSSMPGLAMLTVRFEVGEPRNEAIVKLYNAFYSNQDWIPANLGVGAPLIEPKGIDDVPIVSATLWTDDPGLNALDLVGVAHAIGPQLQRVDGTRDIETIAGPERVVHVKFDPDLLSGYGLAVSDLQRALQSANASRSAGNIVTDNRASLLEAGTFLATTKEVAELVVGVKDGAPILLGDVAEVTLAADQPDRYVSFGTGPASATRDIPANGRFPAVTISVSKKPGKNAVDVAEAVVERLSALRGTYIPDNVNVTITRNYGETARDKALTLIHKLIFATVSVVILVLFTLGSREAVVVGGAVIVTLLVTLFASWAWGFTLNRVSLFALIFSIGILVDDAIVVVENIHRHRVMGGRKLTELIPLAVDEVGGPTILATFTVIAALLPMAFVTGLMGPYMRPIPINASTGMLISLAVAFMFTPWLYRRLAGNADTQAVHEEDFKESRFHRALDRMMRPFLRGRDGAPWRWALLGGLILLILLSVSLVATRSVVMKMLPFDNKSEFQVLVDMPEGTPVEDTDSALQALADYLATVKEVTDYQIYSGTSAPINFNGLVRQYYLRREPYQGDINVNLVPKSERSRKSHEIASSVRGPLDEIGAQFGANIKIVEVPPGPPVLAPLVAEIYGLDYGRQQAVAAQIRDVFKQTPEIVDVDDTIEAAQEKVVVEVDRGRTSKLGVTQDAVATTIAAAFAGADMSYLHDPQAKVAVPIRVELPAEYQGDVSRIGNLRVRASDGGLVALSDVATVHRKSREQTIHHKDLLPVVYVTGDAAGETDSPLYGMASISGKLSGTPIDGQIVDQFFIKQPPDPYKWSLKWDGEWQVTYETFRDMGAAYAVGLILIYLLVVAKFESYGVPLIIMAPIPLTMIGIMPGHALLGQQFTAPSMIGMIALAGIIVRNSILLVDFIQQSVASGEPLDDATISAAAVRARPIILTALAAMLGGFFILDDPIFGGLAVSLIFGLLVSTVLTIVVIPVVYYHYHFKSHNKSSEAAQ
ncbi:MAG: efflux RND transporter permease subunit [Pseudomonadales bacterium]|nr:efflux RND transporter permease subunit [Pseudomonadales bacterium]